MIGDMIFIVFGSLPIAVFAVKSWLSLLKDRKGPHPMP